MLIKAKLLKYANHKSELISHLNIDNSEIFKIHTWTPKQRCDQAPRLENFIRQLSMKFKMLVTIKIYKNSDCSGLDKHKMLFFLLINVKMPTIVGILTFMSRKKIMLS